VFRDQINAMLDDAVPAREFISWLNASNNPVLPYPISEVNISDWRKTGYQDSPSPLRKGRGLG